MEEIKENIETKRRLLWEKNIVMMWLYRIARSGGLLALEYEVGFIPKDMPSAPLFPGPETIMIF